MRFLAALFTGLCQSVLVVFVVVSVVFVVSRVLGDPISALAPADAPKAVIERVRRDAGLSDPLPVQYGRFLRDTARLDFGTSFRTNQPALGEVTSRLGRTLELGGAGLLFAVALGIPLGILAAVRRGTPLDVLARLLALIGQATPNFWLGLILIYALSVQVKWFPTGGIGGLDHLVLPAVTLGAASAAAIMRLTRSGLLDVLGSDCVRTARAKGLAERIVIGRHALRHALLPILSLLGIQVGRIFAGAVIVETIFAWPGIGLLMINAIRTSDYPVVQAGIVFISASIVIANLLVDLSYRVVDPRLRTVAR